MEHVRYQDLDAYCEGISDARAKKNEAVADEKGYTTGALASMQKRGCSVYKHAGIELLFVPGDAKLRVRVTKDEGEGADVPGEPETPAADGDQFDAAEFDADNADND